MIDFPNSKINLGLNVVEKRNDGFHNIETVLYPIAWSDGLEILENKNSKQEFELLCSGIAIAGNLESNLIYKAYQILKQNYSIPPIKIFLHKNIPMGAGLGGGSADAACFINLINSKFNLGINRDERKIIASQLGSDCAFFIENKPVYATQRGDVFEECKINLNKYFILIVYPNLHSDTKMAYSGIVPKASKNNLKTIIETQNITEWKHLVFNDFEDSIFRNFPQIKNIKAELYEQGALYASMSGSGSSVYGIFDFEPNIKPFISLTTFLQIPTKLI